MAKKLSFVYVVITLTLIFCGSLKGQEFTVSDTETTPSTETDEVTSETGVHSYSEEGRSFKEDIKVVKLTTTTTEKNILQEQIQNRTLNASAIIKKLLNKDTYDKLIRPNFTGPPVRVSVTMKIKSITSMNEVNMEYELDFYLRQKWKDDRLRFKLDNVEYLGLSSKLLDELWTPDTFFRNEKKSYLHTATVINRFVRLYPDGDVVTSSRLTVTASCPMNLRLYPMDHQVCGIEIASYGFTKKDILYMWREKGGDPIVEISNRTAALPQFRLEGYRRKMADSMTLTGNYSGLGLEFLFVRSITHYITTVYLPSFLVVTIAYLALWVARDNTTRLAVGVTSVLTMTTIFMANNAKSPPVNYVKALDTYLALCFVGVFSTLMESAAIIYLMKKAKALKTLREEKEKAEAEKAEAEKKAKEAETEAEMEKKAKEAETEAEMEKNGKDKGQVEIDLDKDKNEEEVKKEARNLEFYVAKLDVLCRILFPIAFASFNISYWAYYLNASQLDYSDNYWIRIPFVEN